MTQGTTRFLSARRGVAFAHLAGVMVAVIAICSLAVDLGRVLVARSELQLAADAAARHAVGMLGTGSPPGQVVSSAVSAAGDNNADGQKVVLQRSDVELG